MKHFIYDGTFDGLLTSLFEAYPEKAPINISKESIYSPNLLDIPCYVTTCPIKSERVVTSIMSKLNPTILKTLHTLYLSEVEGFEVVALQYLKLCYKYGTSINLAKNNDTIIQVDTLVRKVHLEVHRFYGFVRFKEISPLYFYARIEPDHNILSLLSNHFTTRFRDQSFMIHDAARGIALVYTQKETYIQQLTPKENSQLSTHHFTDAFEDLFRTFYAHTTIKARHNPRLQKRMMPSRYWKHLVESPKLNL